MNLLECTPIFLIASLSDVDHMSLFHTNVHTIGVGLHLTYVRGALLVSPRRLII